MATRPGGRTGPCHRPLAPGIRNLRSTAKDDCDAARTTGDDILSVRQVRALGVQGVLGVPTRIPKGAHRHVTIDIDGFCPSIAPGTGTPRHGGFLCDAVLEIPQRAARTHEMPGIDRVELAPDDDQSRSTAIRAAQVLPNFPGFVFQARAAR